METEIILRKQTMNLFSDDWYKKTSILIENKINVNGFVYFIKNGKDSKNIKIGMTTNIDERLKSFKTVFDKGVYVIGYIKSSNPFSLEKEIHKDYEEKRTRGEFFKLSVTDIYSIKDVYNLQIKNNYYSNIPVEKMDENNLLIDFDFDLIDLIKNDLKLNKRYRIKDVLKIYEDKYQKKYGKSLSWLGRDISSICVFLGITKINSNINGIRFFELK